MRTLTNEEFLKIEPDTVDDLQKYAQEARHRLELFMKRAEHLGSLVEQQEEKVVNLLNVVSSELETLGSGR